MGRRIFLSRTILTLLLAVTFARPVPGWAGEMKQLAIGSGSTVGIYYAAAAALAKVVNRHSQDTGLLLINQTSLGSEKNIDDVLQGKVAFGLAQADMLFKAANGHGPWEGRPQTNLRGIFALHSEALTLVAASESGIAGLADFKGKRVNTGAPGSSDNDNAQRLLALVGVTKEEVQLREEQTTVAADLLQAGEIDAYIFTVGHPNLSVLEASSGPRKVQLVPLPPELTEALTAKWNFLLPVTIPVEYYPGLERREPVPTVGVKAVLFARADLDQGTVHQVVKTILEDLDRFRRQHLAISRLTVPEMAAVPVLPLHPGVQAYLREAQLLP
jgi:TRAP transporter TAXI family solute receptor